MLKGHKHILFVTPNCCILMCWSVLKKEVITADKSSLVFKKVYYREDQCPTLAESERASSQLLNPLSPTALTDPLYIHPELVPSL